jgi:hypothetical protein
LIEASEIEAEMGYRLTIVDKFQECWQHLPIEGPYLEESFSGDFHCWFDDTKPREF